MFHFIGKYVSLSSSEFFKLQIKAWKISWFLKVIKKKSHKKITNKISWFKQDFMYYCISEKSGNIWWSFPIIFHIISRYFRSYLSM